MNINRRNFLRLLAITLGVITLDGCQISPDNYSASVTSSNSPKNTKLAGNIFRLAIPLKLIIYT